MWIKKKNNDEDRLREYDRRMLRSSFVSLFWTAIQHRRRSGKFTFKEMADRLKTDKSAVSRWFSGESPNWRVDSIADIASALDLELIIEARDRRTGAVMRPDGMRSDDIVRSLRTDATVTSYVGQNPPSNIALRTSPSVYARSCSALCRRLTKPGKAPRANGGDSEKPHRWINSHSAFFRSLRDVCCRRRNVTRRLWRSLL